MLIAVVGGKLQGVEALYLARKAGYRTILIDKNPDAIARNLCDQFIEHAFTLKEPIPKSCPPLNLIFPAVEDDETLAALHIWAKSASIPLAFDPDAYKISSSKRISDDLFIRLGLPAPKQWPSCGFPVVIKPDQESGSQGVVVLPDKGSLEHFLEKEKDNGQPIIQEYLTGPSYSLEIIGQPENYQPLQVTDLHMDKIFDCKRVTAPSLLATNQINTFEAMGITIAEAIQLRGIMDVEVVLHDNKLKLLEIDARFPSQTPMAVYWSTGVNMVEMFCELIVNNNCKRYEPKHNLSVSIEHIEVHDNKLEVWGEHIMNSDTKLSLQTNFFGAEEALTSYSLDKTNWVSTMIFCGNSADEVMAKRNNCYDKIRGVSR